MAVGLDVADASGSPLIHATGSRYWLIATGSLLLIDRYFFVCTTLALPAPSFRTPLTHRPGRSGFFGASHIHQHRRPFLRQQDIAYKKNVTILHGATSRTAACGHQHPGIGGMVSAFAIPSLLRSTYGSKHDQC